MDVPNLGDPISVLIKPGALGLVVESHNDKYGMEVKQVHPQSQLIQTISPGDRIVEFEGSNLLHVKTEKFKDLVEKSSKKSSRTLSYRPILKNKSSQQQRVQDPKPNPNPNPNRGQFESYGTGNQFMQGINPIHQNNSFLQGVHMNNIGFLNHSNSNGPITSSVPYPALYLNHPLANNGNYNLNTNHIMLNGANMNTLVQGHQSLPPIHHAPFNPNNTTMLLNNANPQPFTNILNHTQASVPNFFATNTNNNNLQPTNDRTSDPILVAGAATDGDSKLKNQSQRNNVDTTTESKTAEPSYKSNTDSSSSVKQKKQINSISEDENLSIKSSKKSNQSMSKELEKNDGKDNNKFDPCHKCDICGMEDGHRGLHMQKCRECQIYVHEECYGLTNEHEGVKYPGWKCWACVGKFQHKLGKYDV